MFLVKVGGKNETDSSRISIENIGEILQGIFATRNGFMAEANGSLMGSDCDYFGRERGFGAQFVAEEND